MTRFASILALCFLGSVAPASGNIFGMVCGVVPVPVVCGGSMSPTPTSTGCTGIGCCPGSSCMGYPMMGCKSSRGNTQCVGATMFSEGMCQCTSGACTTSGVCTSTGGTSGSGPFYEENGDGIQVTPENLPAVVALYGCVAFGILTATVVVLRRHRRGHSTAVDAASLVADGDVRPLE